MDIDINIYYDCAILHGDRHSKPEKTISSMFSDIVPLSESRDDRAKHGSNAIVF